MKIEKNRKNLFKHSKRDNCGPGVIYGLGFLGAIVYYLSTSTGFWISVMGIVKAFLWPAFLVHALLKFIGA